MEKKQSCIEWLVEQLKPAITLQEKYINEFLQQAKAMHQEEIKEAWNDGCYQSSDFPKTSDAEKYYNETFGGQDNE